MISSELKAKFEKTIEIKNIDWKIVEEVALSDSNILRPIKGISFEEYLKKILLIIEIHLQYRMHLLEAL